VIRYECEREVDTMANMVGMRTGWDHASSPEPSSTEITTYHPWGMATVQVTGLVSHSPKSALMKIFKNFSISVLGQRRKVTGTYTA